MVGTDQDADGIRLASVERRFWIDRDDALQLALDWLAEFGDAEYGATGRRLQVLIAAVSIHRADPSRSAIDVQQILAWAQQHGEIALQSRCHDVLGSLFEMVGDPAAALEHAVAANDLLSESEAPLMRAAARKCHADALGSAGSLDEARRRYDDALRLVIDDPETNIRYNESRVSTLAICAGNSAAIFLLVVMHTAGEFGPCSAWPSKSTATNSASTVSSHITIVSVGPAKRSMPTRP